VRFEVAGTSLALTLDDNALASALDGASAEPD
jgi:hypothetical protein